MVREKNVVAGDYGRFCSSKCLVDFTHGLEDAGVIKRLQYGEEPELVYG